MSLDFENYIDQEIKEALPLGYPMIAVNKLLGKHPYKIRFAFFSKKRSGYDVLINILVLPASIVLDENTESQIIQLRNYILSKRCMLIVIYEYVDISDLPIFIEECLDLSNPNYLSIRCDRENKFKPIKRELVTDYDYESVRDIIRDIWKGRLVYNGIEVGVRMANIEIIPEICFRCHKTMKVATGIVFPNKKLHFWDNLDWSYFNRIVLIAELDDSEIAQIKPVVEQLRLEEPLVTPIEYRFSQFTQSTYWAAVCPHCNVIKGNHFVEDGLRFVVQDPYSRIRRELEYYSFEMSVSQSLIQKITSGFDGFLGTCYMGWKRLSFVDETNASLPYQ
ncbi:hypothetical protein [Bacteroides ovatus]|uniref:hypothetical protein n=1 Tax=Bacteroides ovatus TaxID=28116 RepID=UPI00202EBA8D|nr:hypothetical protein [Bacteroides ovatus]MCM1723305.1 hypothetical protein [Bacteroides ovatus]MCM1758471.1 hypothetical protein [Bacteroides ovatus]MCM1868958.1 hypothetical protein [Bacteroides ovatus]MCM1911788.1 hypothetical protein [Bacteroides ovatus]